MNSFTVCTFTHQDVTEDICTDSKRNELCTLTFVGEPEFYEIKLVLSESKNGLIKNRPEDINFLSNFLVSNHNYLKHSIRQKVNIKLQTYDLES